MVVKNWDTFANKLAILIVRVTGGNQVSCQDRSQHTSISQVRASSGVSRGALAWSPWQQPRAKRELELLCCSPSTAAWPGSAKWHKAQPEAGTHLTQRISEQSYSTGWVSIHPFILILSSICVSYKNLSIRLTFQDIAVSEHPANQLKLDISLPWGTTSLSN